MEVDKERQELCWRNALEDTYIQEIREERKGDKKRIAASFILEVPLKGNSNA